MIMRIFAVLGAAVALAALPAGAWAQTASPQAEKPQTVQQLFDAGAQASDAKDYAGALAIFETLEKRVAKTPRSLAIVRLRKGLALIELRRFDEARSAVEQALPMLPADDESLAEDRMQGALQMGRILRSQLDYESALPYFDKAGKDARSPVDQLVVLAGKIDIQTFLDPAAAEATVREADALLASMTTPNPVAAAQFVTAKGRLLMNIGRFAEAEKELSKAVRSLGGLTLKVDYNDLVSRSDASIAAMLAGHKAVARNYLVYTGAGRLGKQDFARGADMPFPTCGEEGVQPDDVAVVEFGIADDGHVSYARPIYASRGGPVALVFARAVANWAWQAEDVKDIPLLFRMVTRLELRCETPNPERSMLPPARRAFDHWIESKTSGYFEASAPTQAAQIEMLRAELSRRKSTDGGSSITLAPVLAQLLGNPTLAAYEAAGYGKELVSLLSAAGAPPMARLYGDALLAEARRQQASRYGSLVLPVENYAGDPEAEALAQLLVFDSGRAWQRSRNRDVLDRIIGDSRLSNEDPAKVAALVRRANLSAANKDFAAAQKDFEATGLDEQQCSIVDARPSLRGSIGSSSDYPMDMVMAGVEGWTMVQFDVDAKGGTLGQRSLVSYPPFIFSDAGRKMVSRAHYEQSYRPTGMPGCGGLTQTISFRMP